LLYYSACFRCLRHCCCCCCIPIYCRLVRQGVGACHHQREVGVICARIPADAGTASSCI
jgi:hypothetical protein